MSTEDDIETDSGTADSAPRTRTEALIHLLGDDDIDIRSQVWGHLEKLGEEALRSAEAAAEAEAAARAAQRRAARLPWRERPGRGVAGAPAGAAARQARGSGRADRFPRRAGRAWCCHLCTLPAADRVVVLHQAL